MCLSSISDEVDCCGHASAVDHLVGVLAQVAGFAVLGAIGAIRNCQRTERTSTLVQEVTVRTGLAGHVGEAYAAASEHHCAGLAALTESVAEEVCILSACHAVVRALARYAIGFAGLAQVVGVGVLAIRAANGDNGQEEESSYQQLH